MVATFPDSNSARTSTRTPQLPYLKPCSPAPGIARGIATGMATDPAPDGTTTDSLNLPPRLNKRRQRLLALLWGTAQAAAISLGLWASALPQTQPVAVEADPHVQLDDLWHTLGSKTLAQVLLAAKEQQTDAALAEAKQARLQARLQAQQLRLDAEAQAQTLTKQAAQQAREKTKDAVRHADLIALDATYIGAEQVIYAEAGADVSLKFAARIQCKDGRFGETAVAAPLDSRITPREVRNLAACFPSVETPAGKPIGQAGEWGVAFFQLK